MRILYIILCQSSKDIPGDLHFRRLVLAHLSSFPALFSAAIEKYFLKKFVQEAKCSMIYCRFHMREMEFINVKSFNFADNAVM